MKKIVSLLLCVIFIITAIPFAASAEAELPYIPIDSEDDNTKVMKFTDVIEGKWYYDAVKSVWQKGYMAGTSETKFTPNGALTRAMFVTILAAVSGDDLSKYTTQNDTGFTDVVSGKWYVRAVKWALENGVTAGLGTTFGVNKPLTRAQMAVMIYQFANNGDETIPELYIEKYADASSVPTWAKDGVKFVSKYEMMSGTKTVSGAPYFTPNGTTTRAQAAVVINKMVSTAVNSEYPISSLKLNGNDISKYKIVYGETGTKNTEWMEKYGLEIAELISETIEKATGVKLECAKDTDTAVGAYEILVGKTNREGTKVNIDRSKFDKEAEHIEMQGNYLIIASDEIYKSTIYAAYRFLEECIGYYSMGNNTEVFVTDKEVNVPDGYVFHDAPTAEYRLNFQWNGHTDDLRSGEAVHVFANIVHTLPELANPDYQATWDDHLAGYLSADPCLTDSDNIDNIIRSVKLLLSKRPDADLVWVTQSDIGVYCKCDNCGKIYRTWGRCATYIQILQYLGEAIKDDYPNARVVGLPYVSTHMKGKLYNVTVDDETYEAFKKDYTERYVPSQSLKCPDNVVLCVCTDNTCTSHIIASDDCNNTSNSNVWFQQEFEVWTEICPNIYIWDYLSGDMYRHQVFPFVNNLYDNYQFFRKYNVKGFYTLGCTEDYSDFSALKTYLVGILNWDYTISREEYDRRFNLFLKTYYGEGWSYIKEFIDKTDELSDKNEWNIWSRNRWNDIITRADYIENLDYLMGLWSKAISLAETDEQIEHCKKGSVQIRYIELILMYKDYEDAKNVGDAKANDLYDAFVARNREYRDFLGSIGYSLPTNWTEGLNPEEWRLDN